jgi:MFS family permease
VQALGLPEVQTKPETVTLRTTLALVRIPGFKRLLIAGSLLAAVTMSDAFVYLTLQRRLDFDPVLVPLLFFGSAFAYMALAIPAGRIADQVGRVRMFLGGHLMLVTLYAVLFLAPDIGTSAIIVALVLLGAYYAMTDGVLMAQASAILPANHRASGLSVLVTGTSLARLLASLVFGAAWTAYGLETAITWFGIAMGAAVVGCALLFLATRRPTAAGV